MDREVTITLSEENARFIDEQVKAGVFASVDAVVTAAIARIRYLDEDITEDAWVRGKVQEALDDPRPRVPADEAFARVRAHLLRREV